MSNPTTKILDVMRVSFYLQSGKDGARPYGVVMVARWRGGRVRIGTGERCKIADWDGAAGLPDTRAKGDGVADLRARLESLRASVIAASRDAMESGGGVLSVEACREILRDVVAERFGGIRRTRKQKNGVGDSLGFDAFDVHAQENAAILSPKTLAVYRDLRSILGQYIGAKKTALDWSKLDANFFADLRSFLLSERGLKNTSCRHTLLTLRTFCRWLDRRKIPVHPAYKIPSVAAVPRGDSSPKIYLTQSEVEAIANLPLGDTHTLRGVRDLFLFMCYAGLRYGDSQKVEPSHMDGDFLRLVTGKNRRAVRVPLHPIAKQILVDCGGYLPRYSPAYFNRKIREVAILAGIQGEETVVSYSGAKRIEEKFQRWQLVTAHTAKRTAITNLVKMGVSVRAVCAMTGNSMATISTYILPTDTELHGEIFAKWGQKNEG